MVRRRCAPRCRASSDRRGSAAAPGRLSRLLRDNGLDVVAAVGDAEALLASVAEQRPEIAIVDIRMPPDFRRGLAGIQIRSTYPETAVLILSQYVEPAYATELLADGRGQVGYLLKDGFDVADFIEAVHRAGEGARSTAGRGPARRAAPAQPARPLERPGA